MVAMLHNQWESKIMFGIQIDNVPVRFGSFPFYRTKAEAERIAAIYRADWPHHSYKVVRV